MSEEPKCGKIYWCTKCQVPILTIEGKPPECDICHSQAPQPIYAASDMRPVFPPEHDFLEHELAVKLPSDIFCNAHRLIYQGKTLLHFTLKDGMLGLRGECHAQSSTASDIEAENYDFYLRKAFRANITVLDSLEQEACEYITSIADQHPARQRFVSFSGGKDSTVVAHLVQKSLGDVSLFFADTTLEHFETVDYVHDFAHTRKFPLETRASKNDFFEMSEKLDPPSRIMRWCCSVFKAYPINLFWSSLNELVLGFDGIRRAESKSRNSYPRVFQSEKFARQITVRPILHWSSLAVWLYIYYRKLPFNPLYQKGYSRIGCYLCPYNTSYDDLLNSYYQVSGWQRWLEFLRVAARAQDSGYSEEWIDTWVQQGYWKQRKPRKRNEVVVSQDSDHQQALQYVFSDGIPRCLPELMKPICSVKMSEDGGIFRSCNQSSSKLSGQVGGQLLTILIPEDENPREFQRLVEKQIEKAINCVSCGGCVGICPNKAISVNGKGVVIDNDACLHENCRLCVTTNIGRSGYSCIAMGYKGLRRRVLSDASKITSTIV